MIEDFSAAVVRSMLEFIYKDCTTISPSATALDMLRISDMYQLDGLKAVAEKTIGGNLTVDNVVHVFNASLLYSSQLLKAQTIKFIKM